VDLLAIVVYFASFTSESVEHCLSNQVYATAVSNALDFVSLKLCCVISHYRLRRDRGYGQAVDCKVPIDGEEGTINRVT